MRVVVFLVAVMVVMPARAGEDDALRDEAIGLYQQRCRVDADERSLHQAQIEWGLLKGFGYTGEEIQALAGQLPEDCDFVSFKTAILGAERIAAAARKEADREEARRIEREEAGLVEEDEVRAGPWREPYMAARHTLGRDSMVACAWLATGTSAPGMATVVAVVVDYPDLGPITAMMVAAGAALWTGSFAIEAGFTAATLDDIEQLIEGPGTERKVRTRLERNLKIWLGFAIGLAAAPSAAALIVSAANGFETGTMATAALLWSVLMMLPTGFAGAAIVHGEMLRRAAPAGESLARPRIIGISPFGITGTW